MNKLKETLKNLEQKDWEVIGFSILGTLIAAAFFGLVATSVAAGAVIGLALRGKVQA